ncbi:hypothetical protein FNF27_07377 [Cafeteria roenbergensis]|uniref:Uncharacterized protein n=1 Tax=Cafeteria roenbergensis TaxID=33653 RepID=A0A5A8DPK0_CAFRO|nr:hypothetical protein FNF27_07377 [Cafeteria roenbergensis]
MPDVEVDRSCAGNAFAAAKRPRVGFGSGTKAWDGLSKPSAVLHDIFIDLLRSGLSVCSGSTLMAVVQRRCQVAVLHAAMVDWEARHAFLHAKAPGSHPHESSAAAPTPRT